MVPFAMLIADGTGEALAVNQRWLDMTGLGRHESLGAGWLDVVDREVRGRLRDDLMTVADRGNGVTSDYQLAPALQSRWVRWWLSRHELDGIPLVAVAAADVDDDYARQANLYHLATHDSLTGLVNRSHFMDTIEQALRRNQRAARHVGVVYVDLDGFKRVNDRGGHSLGDRVLFAIASRLRHAVRSADMVARIGGDEFAVLCEGLGAADQAEVVARRIALALTESVELDGERWSVAASVGAAVDQGAPDTAEDLVDRADRAMYSVKLTRRRSDELRPAEGAAPAAVLDPPLVPGPAAVPVPYPAPVPVADAPATGRRQGDEPLGVVSGPDPTVPPAPGQPAGERLSSDVGHLRESIDSIRRMLDRLLDVDSVIDIREGDPQPEAL